MSSLEALVERSREPSRSLQVISGYFRVNAALITIGWLSMFGAALSGFTPLAPLLHLPPLRYVAIPLTIGLWWHVGQLLSARRREGGFWAVATLLLPLLMRVVSQPARLNSLSLVTAAVGLLLIGLVWKELE